MRFLTRSLMGLFLLALTLGLLAMGGYSVYQALEARRAAGAQMPMARERVFAANVIPVEFATIAPVLTAYGEVQSTRELELRAAAAGTILDLAPDFEDGAEVRAGEVLVTLDPAEARAARDTAAASVAEAQAALAEAERALALSRDDLVAAQRQAALQLKSLDRQRSLSERGVGSAAALEGAELSASASDQAVLNRRAAISSAEAKLDTARTSLTRARITLSEAERKLADTEIRAEFTGRLAEVSAVAGGLVSNNEMLGKLIDPAALEVAFRVSTGQFSRLIDAEGQLRGDLPVRVLLQASDGTVSAQAQLSRVSASVETGVTGRLLFARITQGAAGLRPGDFVTVKLTEPTLENVARIPAAAVSASETVLRLGPEDRLEEAKVSIVRRQGDSVIIRTSTLKPGQEIVAERTPLLGQGIKLRPMRSGQVAAAPETIALDDARRAKLIAWVEGNANMPDTARKRFLSELNRPEVPKATVEKLESKIGG